MANKNPKIPTPNGKYKLGATIKLKIFSSKRKGISLNSEINTKHRSADITEKIILNKHHPIFPIKLFIGNPFIKNIR